MRSEEEIDKLIEGMIERNKGKYITQGVSFNKTCPRQMDLLKKSLMSSVSFSGLAKEMLALRFEQREQAFVPKLIMGTQGKGSHAQYNEVEIPKLKNVGNFL